MPWPLHAHEGGAVPIPQEAEWDTGPVWTGAENIISTGIWSLDHPAHSKSHTKHATSAHITGLIICECYMLLLSECCTCSSQAIQADHTTTTSNEQKLTELKQHRVTKVCEITNGSSVCSVLTGLVLSSAGSHTYDQFKTWPGHWLVWHSEGSYCFNFDHEDEGSKIFWNQKLTAQRQNVTYRETWIIQHKHCHENLNIQDPLVYCLVLSWQNTNNISSPFHKTCICNCTLPSVLCMSYIYPSLCNGNKWKQ